MVQKKYGIRNSFVGQDNTDALFNIEVGSPFTFMFLL